MTFSATLTKDELVTAIGMFLTAKGHVIDQTVQVVINTTGTVTVGLTS